MKKGYTLIELITALALCSLVAVSMISLLLRYNSNFKLESKRIQNHFYAEEALLFIDNTIKSCKQVNVTESYIELYYENSSIKKVIGQNLHGDVVITHVENGVNSTTNNVLNNIASFTVSKKENTIYVSITVNTGERFSRCIGIKLIS